VNQPLTSPHNPAAPDWLQVPSDLNHLDPALWPGGTRRDDSGALLVAGHRCQDLLAQFGSPLYVLDEMDFRARAQGFRREFANWDVYYAGKAFLNRTVLRWVEQEGLSLDVCSGNELLVALAADFPPARIEFHGNNKSEEELGLAIDAGVGRIIADSFVELERIEALASARDVVVPILVRITTGVEAHTHQYIATAHEDQKFGFSIHSGRALEALQAASEHPHIKLMGIHSHIGSQIFDTAGFAVAARKMLGVLAEFRDLSGVQLPELNLGGGFGIAYTSADQALAPGELASQLTAIVSQACAELGLAELRLAIEPGRAICGPPGVALYTVGTIKPVVVGPELTRTYVAVDGGMSDNIRTALYRADYTASLANRCSSAEPILARVVGKHCESGDQLVRDVYLPADIVPGDILAVPGSGAYARSLASNYNHATRPAVVALREGEAQLIMRRETLDDLLNLDIDLNGR
jgi:diaminopimelate decarboxylase